MAGSGACGISAALDRHRAAVRITPMRTSSTAEDNN